MSESKQIAVAEQPQQVALTVQDRAVIALGGTEREAALKALAKKYADITEVKNKAGRQQVHAAGMELANERIATKKTGETAREDANALQKAVIDRQKVLIGLIEPEEKRLIALRDKFDAAEEAEKIARAAAEKARVDAIRASIDEIKDCVVVAMGKTADEISSAIAELESVEITPETHMELAGEAQAAQVATVAKLREMLTAQVALEAEAARIAAEVEANRVETKRLADLAAELERQARAARDKQAETDRLAREQREAADRVAQLAREEADRLAEARRAAAQKILDDQAAELKRQQDAADEAARLIREAAEAAAKLEADHAEGLIENLRIDADREAAFEARQKEEQRRADEAERIRREHTKFIINGPGDVEIARTLAGHYDVEIGDVMGWLKKFDYTAADEQLAAENVAANQLEKAA